MSSCALPNRNSPSRETEESSNHFSPSPLPTSPRSPSTSQSSADHQGQLAAATDYPIIAHCHLWWDWVWQRPQQFLSRLSARHPVLYIETHPPSEQLVEPTARLSRPQNGDITLLQIQFPTSMWSDGALVDRERRRLVQQVLAGPLAGRFDNPVQWFYDPMAVTAFAGHIDCRAIVYDCMDELSQFRGAPPEIRERERLLLSLADVVFTGGRRLWEAKKQHNTNCHFYGCGVDVEHFSRAMDPALPAAVDVREIPKPVLGYIGVVDERLDYDLLRRMADLYPEWNVVVVGPSTKLDPESLPRRANLHWLGGRPYSELPSYAKAFDVCLMPFARNEATEYINPTKALEYMATGRPIVSTAIADVVSNFGEVVHIAHSPDEFLELCRRCIQQPDQTRVERGLAQARNNTWESIVSRLEGHIQEALDLKIGKTFSHAEHINLSPKGGEIALPLP